MLISVKLIAKYAAIICALGSLGHMLSSAFESSCSKVSPKSKFPAGLGGKNG